VVRAAPATTPLVTPTEQAEIEQRLLDFYAQPHDPAVMSKHLPKYDAASGAEVHPNTELQVPTASTEPLEQTSQGKATAAFRAYQCDPKVNRHFKKSPCHTTAEKADVENDDLVSDLVAGWLDDSQLTYDLGEFPTTAQATVLPYSDDYWRQKWGGLAYRYSVGDEYKTYDEAIAAYAQPHEWLSVQTQDTQTAQSTIASWSPAEKYDATVGDEQFTFTNQQKGEGAYNLTGGDVPDWMGICDGWATAAILTPRATRAVRAVGPQGLSVEWYPADIRALTSEAFAHGNFDSNFIGGHCDETNVILYPNGRIKDQQCFSSNPATFHLALGNLIGIAHQSFIMDASFDSEVWNQPVQGYQFTYFNPLDIKQRSADWHVVAVPYDKKFKAQDRFQNPLTRGTYNSRTDAYSDKKIKKVVGVIATVWYNDEYQPNPGPTIAPDQVARVTYTYDLELGDDGDGNLVPTGGEWQNNTHPNFLWVPAKGTRLALSGNDAGFTLDSIPTVDATQTAAAASANGLPLCSVLNQLVARSTDNTQTQNFSICNP
jgi:hypothetical protein